MSNSQAEPQSTRSTSPALSFRKQWSFWIMAARPRTLTLSITPVIVATSLAWAAERKVHWSAVVAALIGSVFIQLGTNIHNDAADFERGGDGPDRIGPPRDLILPYAPSRSRQCLRA